MQPELALSLCHALGNDSCLFGYSDNFNDEVSARLIELASAASHGASSALSTRGRLGYVMVEAFQNIVRHRTEPVGLPPWGAARSLLVLRYGHEGQHLIAENAVTRDQRNALDGLLTGLRSRSAEELKGLFMEGIQRASTPGVRGAGLGLIEMARRSGGRFNWDFQPAGTGLFRFSLVLELGEPLSTGGLLDAADLRSLVMDNGWPLFFAGKWSAAMQAVLLKFAEAPRSVCEVVDRMGAWLVHAAPAFFVVHGSGRRLLSLGGLMHREGARLMEERSAPGPGPELRLVPVGGLMLAVAELEI